MSQHSLCAAHKNMTTRHHLLTVEELATLIRYRPDPLLETTFWSELDHSNKKEETMAYLGTTSVGHFTAADVHQSCRLHTSRMATDGCCSNQKHMCTRKCC